MRLHFASSYRSSSSWEKLRYKRGVTEEPAAKIWNFHSQGEEPREEFDLPAPSGPALVVSIYCQEDRGRTAGAPGLRMPGSGFFQRDSD